MSDFANVDVDLDDDLEVPTSYSSSSPAPATNRSAITAPGAGVGRRKEAIARVRLVPGTGKWSLNGRPLDVYFPNKVHQQLVSEPFRTVGVDGNYNEFKVVALLKAAGFGADLHHGEVG